MSEIACVFIQAAKTSFVFGAHFLVLLTNVAH
uniref:Uncharacterized protein n=1 Tax=Anguilla anguilla TaxID=7936 RepID=A0A0E9V8P7_ANGAN